MMKRMKKPTNRWAFSFDGYLFEDGLNGLFVFLQRINFLDFPPNHLRLLETIHQVGP